MRKGVKQRKTPTKARSIDRFGFASNSKYKSLESIVFRCVQRVVEEVNNIKNNIG